MCRRLPRQERLASCRAPWIGEIASRHRCPRPSTLLPVFRCHPLTTSPRSAVCSHYRLLPPNKKIKARYISTTNRYDNVGMSRWKRTSKFILQVRYDCSRRCTVCYNYHEANGGDVIMNFTGKDKNIVKSMKIQEWK